MHSLYHYRRLIGNAADESDTVILFLYYNNYIICTCSYVCITMYVIHRWPVASSYLKQQSGTFTQTVNNYIVCFMVCLV